jgi:rRNA-processing protein EBP2
LKRQKKNEKYGFGGKKRFAKSGDAISSGDMRKFSVTKMKTGGGRKGGGSSSSSKRPGKSRRKTTR